MRDEVLTELVNRGLDDEDFRGRMLQDPEGTLEAEGYQLEEEELAAVRDFHQQVSGVPEGELDEAIAGAARRQGG